MAKFRNDDFIDVTQIAETFGYSPGHVQNMTSKGRYLDPNLYRLRVETTPEWREAHGSHAQLVYRYGDVKHWHKKFKS